MNEEELKKACKAYLDFYHQSRREELAVRPDSLEYPDTETATMITSVAFSDDGKKATFTYKSRKYYCTSSSSKVLIKDSNKKFTISLTKKAMEKLNVSDKEVLSENAVAIVAYVSRTDLLPDWAESELKEYLFY